MAVIDRLIFIFIIIMAFLTEVMRTKAAVDCNTATVLALPVDLLCAMFVTFGSACADFLQ